MSIEERIVALLKRGLSRRLAREVWAAGDPRLVTELEGATVSQIHQLNRLDRVRRTPVTYVEKWRTNARGEVTAHWCEWEEE